MQLNGVFHKAIASEMPTELNTHIFISPYWQKFDYSDCTDIS